MKTIKMYLAIAVATVFAITACTKEETVTKTVDIHHTGTEGQALVKGTVTYLNAASGNYEAAPWSVIKIATDTTTKKFDQYWLTDSAGVYAVKGLGVGNYFITAQYTDKFTGAVFNSPGAVLSVKNTIDDVVLDFKLK